MNYNTYSVYDSKAEAYTMPFYVKHEGEALRLFQNWVNDPDHPIAKHPADYTLFHLGQWDDQTGTFVQEHINSIVNALQLQDT